MGAGMKARAPATASSKIDTPVNMPTAPGPVIFVIFGGGGDLAWRKLVPSLYYLHVNRSLLQQFAIIGVDRAPFSDVTLRKRLMDGVRQFSGLGAVKPKEWKAFAGRISYQRADFGSIATYRMLARRLKALDRAWNAKPTWVFHLATPPTLVGVIPKFLAAVGLARERQRARIVVEKPIGSDLESARRLNTTLTESFHEPQIFRIDHYLGKETVQNIMAFRFANGIFEPIWNRRYIDHVQISVAETVGVEGRGSYFDHAGSLRDMVPNHIMQLISLTAMEPPISFDANAVRDEQAKILHAIQPISDEDVLSRSVRGQYGEGIEGGQRVPAYRTESDVAPDSRTETFVAMKLLIDNWRWAGVPFYLRTGKRMPARNTHIVIQFRQAPFVLFRDTSVEHLMPNQLVLHIQPEEGISLQFAAKVPGPVMRLGSVDMNFEYQQYFGKQPSTGYERLLHDCMIGDQTLFQRADMVEVGWNVVNPMLDLWKALPPRNFPNYASGTWGPKEADELLERDGRSWRNFEK